jgi:hypothetical protein
MKMNIAQPLVSTITSKFTSICPLLLNDQHQLSSATRRGQGSELTFSPNNINGLTRNERQDILHCLVEAMLQADCALVANMRCHEKAI